MILTYQREHQGWLDWRGFDRESLQTRGGSQSSHLVQYRHDDDADDGDDDGGDDEDDEDDDDDWPTCAPDVKLPLSESEHSAKNAPRIYSW